MCRLLCYAWSLMKKLRSIWQSLVGETDRKVRVGRLTGLLFVAAGFLIIGKAWDGSANLNSVPGQVPYLLSGGFMGLGLVITGSMLLFLSSLRAEREVMVTRFDEMTRLLSRNLGRMTISSNGSASSGLMVTVASSGDAYHQAECKVLDGKEGLSTVPVEVAVMEGLKACRACNPPKIEELKVDPATAGSGTQAQ